MKRHRCEKTGLQLIAEGGERTFRVAKPKYGALSAPERSIPQKLDRVKQGRYDSLGRTLYVASDAETAYAEVLSPFKRQLGVKDPLEADAEALGMTRDEFLESVSEEWSERGFMGMGAIPRQWRTDRALYNIYGEGVAWYVDVEAPDSIAVLEARLEETLASEGVEHLTTAVLRSENRVVTTAVGSLLRRIELDDGSLARGIQFGSKFGGGWCRAIWWPADADEWTVDLVALSPEPILLTDEALARACERFRIRVF